ncbi:hypothetical protein CCP3SC1_440021 [Gammaproteobacteria bacterium]
MDKNIQWSYVEGCICECMSIKEHIPDTSRLPLSLPGEREIFCLFRPGVKKNKKSPFPSPVKERGRG